MFEILPEFAKMALTYIAYICHKDKRIDETFFCYEEYGSFLKIIDQGELKVPSDLNCFSRNSEIIPVAHLK